MGNAPEHVHATSRAEKILALVSESVLRSRASDRIRAGVLGLARPSYRHTLRLISGRGELPIVLNARRLYGTGAEIGVDEGLFSEHLLEHWRGEKLISVDPWLEMPEGEYQDTCNTSQASMEEKLQATQRRLERFGDRSEIWRETSVEAAAHVAPKSLDFVYLDARHSYEGVTEDLQHWFPLVRPGGIMAGHDYNDGTFIEGVHGVRSAVDQFFAARSIAVRHTYADVPAMSWIVEVPAP